MAHLSESFAAGVRAALAAEALSVQRYLYFAQIAEIEGHAEIAKLFRDIAATTSCVAHGHLDVLRDADSQDESDIGETALNLASSVADALRDGNESYPQLTSVAFDEGQCDVASWLSTITALKKAHLLRLDAALRDLPEPVGKQPAVTPGRTP